MKILSKNRILILILILLIASFFRLWQIDSIPSGLYPDEAMNANDALSSLENNQFKVFYTENNGREGLYLWLVAGSFKLFGPSIWSLRLVGAILGILTVLALYLLAKELFNEKIALISSFFLSVSFWHTNFSRIAFRGILVPLILCLSFYFLLRGFRKKSSLSFIWSGIFFGLGLYTYLAFRAAVLILGIVILWKIIEYWQKEKPITLSWSNFWHKVYLKDGWWKLDLFLLVIIIMAIPLGLYFYHQPQDFIGRAGGVSIFAGESPIQELIKSSFKALGMFNVYGDGNWRHNYSGSPMLVWSVGIFFILGIVAIFKKPLFHRIFLFSWFAIMLLPAIFTMEGMPHALRTIGVIPVAYLFAALGLIWLFEKIYSFGTKWHKFLAIALLIISFIQPAITNLNKYFIDWGQSPEVASAFSADYVQIGEYLNSLPESINKYVLVNKEGEPFYGLSIAAQTPIFIERTEFDHNRAIYLPWQDLSQIKTDQPAVIILMHNDQSLEKLQEIFPQGKIIREKPYRIEI